MVDLMSGFILSEDDNFVMIIFVQGVNLIDVVKELVLILQDIIDYVLIILKVVIVGNFIMIYQFDDVCVFFVQFSVYLDDEGVLGKMSGFKLVKIVLILLEFLIVKVGEIV